MRREKLDQGTLMRALDWAYGLAVEGKAGLDSAEVLGDFYKQRGGTAVQQTNALIRWQVAKAGASGFLTGLGGPLTLPILLPLNITSVLYVQLRMIAAIAHLGGHDVRADEVRTLAYLCLCESAAADVVKDIGTQIGLKLTRAALGRLSGAALLKVNQKVGFQLLTKFGEKGLINVAKAIPLVGGLIGGTFDSVSTKLVGNVARKHFIESA